MLLRLLRCAPRSSVRLLHNEGLVDTPPNFPLGESDMNNRTRISFLSQDMMDTDRVGIRGLSSVGFRMYDGSFLYGPIAVFPTVALSWRVPTPADITPDSLRLFFMLQPQLDEEAIATFNFLNSEFRYVAGAFFPPAELEVSKEQNFRSMGMVQSPDTMSDSPFRFSLLGPMIPAQDACMRIYGSGPEGQRAWEMIEKIRLEDLAKKEAYLRDFRERKERELLEAGKSKRPRLDASTRRAKEIPEPKRKEIEGEKTRSD
ncbi:hypothetical protein M3Y99_00560400 [Aphelenchoides fujianensis]|nr:hypothetical protein M3Y99_00560400 [Aphelenchoides fujianensis]